MSASKRQTIAAASGFNFVSNTLSKSLFPFLSMPRHPTSVNHCTNKDENFFVTSRRVPIKLPLRRTLRQQQRIERVYLFLFQNPLQKFKILLRYSRICFIDLQRLPLLETFLKILIARKQ